MVIKIMPAAAYACRFICTLVTLPFSTFLRRVRILPPRSSSFKNVNMSDSLTTSSLISLSSSSDKVVECVPNFSEGRRSDVIEAIASAIRGSDGCTLLDVDPGESTNRTVYTFVGNPLAVVAGALQAARTAHKLIDMTKHHGIPGGGGRGGGLVQL